MGGDVNVRQIELIVIGYIDRSPTSKNRQRYPWGIMILQLRYCLITIVGRHPRQPQQKILCMNRASRLQTFNQSVSEDG